MKKIIKGICTIIITVLFLFGNTNNVSAASGSISVSSSSSKVIVGNTFTVTVRISSSAALGSWEWTISYDTNKFKLISGDKNVADVYQQANTKSKSYTYKFKAISTGSGKITVKSAGAIDMNENKVSLSIGSKSVNVITQAQLEASYSKNNNLKSLSVDGYKLSPTFSKSTTEYRVEVGANTESIKIKASVEDSKASVSGTGIHEVSEGENKFNITVKAENNSTKTYKVIVNVTDPNPINVTFNGNDYVVVKRESNMETPDGFEKTQVEINEQKIPAFYNETNNFTLVGLKNSEGEIQLFLYDKEKNTYEIYKEVALDQLKLYPLNIDKKFDDAYKETTTSIEGVEFKSLKMDNSEYSIIHARDLISGKDEYYTYDSIANSVIRFTNESTLPLLEEIENYKLLILVLGAETVLIIIILICILIVKAKNKKKRKKLYLEELKKKREKELLEQKQKEKKNEIIDNKEEDKEKKEIVEKKKKTRKKDETK